jgi:hypothetical protein
VILEQAQRLAILAKSGPKTGGLFPRELHDAQLRDHDRPTEDRDDGQKREDNLAGNGGLLEREEETTGR